MRRIFIFTALLFPFLGNTQVKSTSTVQMDLVSEIKSSTSLGFTLNPIIVNGAGGLIYYSFGGSFNAMNIANKFNLFTEYNLNTGRYDKNNNEYSYKSLDFDKKNANLFEFTIGYTFDEAKNNTEKTLTLAKVANTNYITNIKAKELVSKIIRVGYNHQGQFLSGTFEPVGVGQTNYMIYNPINNLIFGYQNVNSLKSIYKTDKFGTVHAAYQDCYYIDLLVALPNSFTYIENKEQSTTSNPVLTPDLSMIQQNEFRENFRKSPIGFRAGYKTFSSTSKQDFLRYSFGIEVGSNTGYYQSSKSFGISSLFQWKITFGIGFLQSLK